MSTQQTPYTTQFLLQYFTDFLSTKSGENNGA